MISEKYFAVIGKNFGDEGKGYTVDHLCKGPGKSLVIRANGGAQSGHTVINAGKRFVFHELGSGSFYAADTFWAKTFHPDLFKLRAEYDLFKETSNADIKIFSDPDTSITIIDDVLLNMAMEISRGNNRHGSCGMGIYECELREEAGFKITLEEIRMNGTDWLIERLEEIRRDYLPLRLSQINSSNPDLSPYLDMLRSPEVLINYAEVVYENLSLVTVADDVPSFLEDYDRVIFENGQGLLLDSELEEFYPHVTGSRTGLFNINLFMKEYADAHPLHALFVTRTYVTRHGAGALSNECSKEDLGVSEDITNQPNPWQGHFRYAYHDSFENFLKYINQDIASYEGSLSTGLMITHLSETGGHLLFKDKKIPVDSLTTNPAFKDFTISTSDF